MFTRYHGNRLVSSTEKAFDLEKWDACEGQLSDWSTADAVGAGVDLGGRDDLAALAFVARFVDTDAGDTEERAYRYEVMTYAYIADDTERDLTKAPFADFVHNDLLENCRFPITELQAKAVKLCTEYDVFGLAFDPSGALAFAESMTAHGINAVRMGQNCSMFNEPIRDLLDCIRKGKITHDGNRLLRWAINNAVVIPDRQDRWMFDKRDSNDKIDPVVAMVMAFRMASLAPERASGSLFVG